MRSHRTRLLLACLLLGNASCDSGAVPLVPSTAADSIAVPSITTRSVAWGLAGEAPRAFQAQRVGATVDVAGWIEVASSFNIVAAAWVRDSTLIVDIQRWHCPPGPDICIEFQALTEYRYRVHAFNVPFNVVQLEVRHDLAGTRAPIGMAYRTALHRDP